MNSGIEIDDFYQLSFLKSHDISSDGMKIAYSLASYVVNEKEDEFHHKEKINLWLLDRSTNQSRQLTFGDQDANPSWSPDTQYLAFTSKREEKSQLCLLPMAGGEPRQLTNLENGVGSKAIWSSDGRYLFFSAGKDEKLPEANKPYRYTREFYRMDGMGNVDRVLQDIYQYDLETEKLHPLTRDQLSHTQPILSPDGTRILTLSMFEEDAIDAIFPRLYLLEIESKTLTKLSNYHITTATWLDEQTVLFIGGDPVRKAGSKTDLFRLDLDSGNLENLTQEDKYGVSGGLQADMPTFDARLPKLMVSQGYAYINVQIGGTVQIRRVALDGSATIETVVGGDRSNFISAMVGDELFFVSSSHLHPIDLYVLDQGSGVETQLTDLNDAFLSTRSLPQVKNIHFSGAEGTEVEGWYLSPTTGDPPYPTLLNIHGGPHSGWGSIFQFENLYLCSAGYGVLMVNQRGSTGYGDQFSTRIVGDWGNLDYRDLMDGVDYVIQQGWADAERLGCFGISGGGNLTSWIVGQTNRFKAAVPENPVTNWQSFYGVSDIGRWFATKEMGGLPWDIPEIYTKASPISYAHQCTTPTLMIQHENDLRCPPEQTEQFYAVLRDVGCIVEMLRMPGTPHVGSLLGPLEIRAVQNQEILAWFQKYVH